MDDVLEPGELAPGRPELEHGAVDDTALLRVDDLGVDLLSAQGSALVLQDLLAEVVRQVAQVGVGRGGRQDNVIALAAHQFDDQVLGFGRGRTYKMGLRAQAHTELDLIPGLLQIVPCGQLVQPAPVELRPTEPLRL